MRNSILPIVSSLRTYSGSTFFRDLVGGITVAALLVPQAMAYAELMGVPAIYGLYTCLVPLLVYGLFSTSRLVSIGPVAIASLIVLVGISDMGLEDNSEILSVVLLVAFLTGMVQVLMGLLRLGFIANFLSKPILSGFISAAAITIIVSQIPTALGIQRCAQSEVQHSIPFMCGQFADINIPDACFFAGAMILMVGLRRIHKLIPGALIVVIGSLIISYILRGQYSDLHVLGAVPSGVPGFSVPTFDWQVIKSLLPLVFTLALISFIDTTSIAKKLQRMSGDHKVMANRELIALGLSKSIGALFQSIPSSASFSRSAINHSTGAKTQVSNLVCALIILVVLLFLTPLLYHLPKAALAAIIVFSVVKLIDFGIFRDLWKQDRFDLALLTITFVSTLTIGIIDGIFIGVISSFVVYIYQSLSPTITTLVNVPGTRLYKDPERFETESNLPESLIVRYNKSLFFGNAYHFRSTVVEMCRRAQPVKHVLLDATQIDSIDSTGVQAIDDLDQELQEMGAEMYICGAIGPVRDQLFLAGFLRSSDLYHGTIDQAVEFIQTGKKNPVNQDFSMQSTFK